MSSQEKHDFADLFFDFSIPDEKFIVNLSTDPREALLVLRRTIREWMQVGTPRGRRLLLARFVSENFEQLLGGKKVNASHILRAIELMDRQDEIAVKAIGKNIGSVRDITPSMIDQKIAALRDIISTDEVTDEPTRGGQEAAATEGAEG